MKTKTRAELQKYLDAAKAHNRNVYVYEVVPGLTESTIHVEWVPTDTPYAVCTAYGKIWHMQGWSHEA